MWENQVQVQVQVSVAGLSGPAVARAEATGWEGAQVSWDRLVEVGYEPVAAAPCQDQPLLAGVVGLFVEVVLRLAEVA